MRKTISSVLVVAIMLTTGCFGSVKTQEIVLDSQTPRNLIIGVTEANIDVSESSTSIYKDYKNDIYRTLMSESHGLIGVANDQPLRLFVTFRYKLDNSQWGIGQALLAMGSVFFFPLAFVTNSNTQEYSVNYVIKDLDNNVIYQQGFTDKVEGTYAGWYFFRGDGYAKFLKKAAEFSGKNAALHVIKSIKENSATIAAAAKNAPGMSARVP